MKKYLIVVMAFVTSYAFVSCHDDELGGSIIEQKKQTFEAAFIKAFGQPDPTHNWGFRMRETEGVTRGEIDANGNMWVDAPTYGPTERHHEVDGVIVPGDIYNYVNRVADRTWNYGTSFPVNLRNYYVSQIFEGDATYKTYQTIMNNGTATFVGSDNMDYICRYAIAKVMHCEKQYTVTGLKKSFFRSHDCKRQKSTTTRSAQLTG